MKNATNKLTEQMADDLRPHGVVDGKQQSAFWDEHRARD